MSFLSKLEILAGKVLPFDLKKKPLSLKKVEKNLKKLRQNKKQHLRTVTPEENLAHELKEGDRVRMIEMGDDPNPIAPGTEGVVRKVNWFNQEKAKAKSQ
jgi:hypothetical protein